LRRDHAEHRAHDVDHRSAGAQRLTDWPGHEGKARLKLHHLVQHRAMLVGAGEIALEREKDEARVQRRELLVAAAQPLHRTRPVILQHNIRARDQAVNHRPTFLPLQVDRETALVAVERGEEPGAKAAKSPGMVAPWRRLDLDHIGAELGKDQPGGRPHDRVAELQDLDAGERRRQQPVGHQAAARRRNASRLPA
jgi:hypothetical protein